MQKTKPGINIQFPISSLIVSGEKTVETRTYKIPEHYLNQEIYLIETPGKKGIFKARAVAIIKFTNCFKYKNKKEFHLDFLNHKVEKGSEWDWREKDKWGWEVKLIKKIPPIEIMQSRGIVFTKDIVI